MPLPNRYTTQIGPSVTPEIAGELAAWGEHRNVSMGEVARECIEGGLVNLRLVWTREHGPLPAELLAAHVERQKRRGEEQSERRRSYAEQRAAGGIVPPSRKPKTSRRRKRAEPEHVLRTESGDVSIADPADAVLQRVAGA